MNPLKNLTKVLALTLFFALSCGAVMAAELVVVAHADLLAEEGPQTWLNDLAQMGVTTRVVMAADFEAVQTSPYLAILIVQNLGINLEVLPVVMTNAVQRAGIETGRNVVRIDNKLAEGQIVLVFSTAAMGGMRTGLVFSENEDAWKAALSGLVQ